MPLDFDRYLFHSGKMKEAYQHFGAHLNYDQDGHNIGASFSVWAPHARKVNVIGDFNGWNGQIHQMKKISDEGIWYIEIKGVSEYDNYKYEIFTAQNKRLEKSDPFAFHAETRPNTASKLYNLDGYDWHDQDWLRQRETINYPNRELLIYEVHFGSFKKKDDGNYYSYGEMADELIPYVKDQGYTHIEILPLIEHPFDGSWGYQGTGYYAATSRYGTPKDLMYFIDRCHQNGLGVILDWVPGHYCKDPHGLYLFDGEPTFEYPFDDVRENKVWGTVNFDLGRNEVRSFLISNAVFWINYFHVDGFRIDAVSNLIYWLGNESKGTNEGAITFIKMLNESVKEYSSNILMIAEDSTAYPNVTKPTSQGGLGFNYKWNMGWMNDVLDYFTEDPLYRKYKHHNLTFGMSYAYNEQFILPFSHDEVVHGKGSLIGKMPGDYWQKFANYRVLMGFLMSHPGKKLIFMGGEFAQMHEWKDHDQLDWNLFDYPTHNSANRFVKDIIGVYRSHKALYELDHSHNGFRWIDANNNEQSIYSFIRFGKNDQDLVIIVMNCTPLVYQDYKIGVPHSGVYSEIINSDKSIYGGSDQYNGGDLLTINEGIHGFDQCLSLTIAPLSISYITFKN
ncbi:1,4-alpha-glucan branching protein GlgB [Haloplasma contractile]|nr:1,4-alpha-glucan branching protein GlgB [Haloplasma contractile]